MIVVQRFKLSMLVTVPLLLISCQNGELDAPLDDNTLNNMPLLSSAAPKPVDMQTDLINHNWTLLSAVDSDNQPVTALTDNKDKVLLSFREMGSQQLVGFSVGCNAMGGEFTVEDSVLFIDQVVGDAQYCVNLNDAESLLAQAMRGSSQLSLSPSIPPILTQITEADKTFIWQGASTADVKQKQQSDTVYWEVKGKEQPCPDGTTKMCLEVRPIDYNSQGVKVAEGKWALFAGEIEGYNHERRQAQIIRLQRFAVAADAPQLIATPEQAFTYVFDAVIENLLAD